MNEAPLGLLFAILALLLLLSAFFSGSETGMMSLNRYRLKHLKKTGHRGAIRASKLLDKPDHLISLILIGNNAVNIVATSIATVVAIRLFGDIGVVVASVVLTVVVLLFAEITPKTIAAYHPERIAFPVSIILLPLRSLLYPVILVVNKFTHLMLRVTGAEPGDAGDALSVDELRTIVGDAGHLIPKRHRGMLLNILDLEQVTVEDIMIPRAEIFGIDIEDDIDSILTKFRESQFSRIPVYRNDINQILGIIRQRDLAHSIDANGRVSREKLLEAMEKPYFVPENTPLHKQLFNFQKQKLRMGIVVDEYGVVQGITTLEDILEEIVGEFTSDMQEMENPDISRSTDGSFIIDGTATIRDINRSLKWELPTDGAKTLNGLLLEHLESFPEGNVGVRIGKYLFEILDIQDNLIQSCKAKALT